ncbi:protoporphyrinogen/coproporphyrinogen oxidase [Salsipaludibacter albus]|uniref:protoporphyrinogen/coproporphyrinogen oxidase n=1 Tax=Salsipaludibacter albus TaxID=2849650 RepID=UPI001EE40F94|nr:FAD-dependent oxidoreductase [Salsipaludibacter albus]
MSDRVRIAVLGAGPAGLAAAVATARAGHAVEVFEAGDQVGGMTASPTIAGQRVDLGSHRLHPVASPPVERLLREALGDDLQGRRRRGRIHLEGRWLDFPLRPVDMVTHLPPSFVAGALWDVAVGPWRSRASRRATDRTVGEGGPPDDDALSTLRRRLGPTVADRFYRPYLTKLYGVDPSRLHAEVADRRVAARRATDVVARMLRPRPEVDFRYPRTGFGQLAEGLADLARGAGATIHLASAVTAVTEHVDRVTVTAGATTTDVDVVVSSLPAPLLVRMAGAGDDVVGAASALVHRGLHLVHLDLDAPRLSQADALYFPGTDTPVARVSEPRNFRENPDDPPDHSVVCAEIPYDPRGPAPDTAALARTVTETLQRAGLAVPQVRGVTVRSLPRVYPVYTAGSRRALDRLEDWVAGRRRILTFGRQGLHTPDNTHHVLAMGLDVADVVGADGIDHRAWARRRAAYRDFVVED